MGSKRRPRASGAGAARLRAPAFASLGSASWLPSLRSLLVAAGILVAGVGLYVVVRETSIFSIDQVDVQGAPPGVAARVRAALEPIAGSSLATFDERDANRRIAAVAEVAGATYDRAFPHTLRVIVRTERPVALLRRGREAWLVSDSARVLRQVVTRPLPGRLPRVWLPPTEDPLVGAVLDGEAAIAVRTIASINRARLPARVRTVRSSNGEVTIALASGTQILIGDTARLRLKLATAAKILPDAQGMAYLDVSVPERVVAGASPIQNPQVES